MPAVPPHHAGEDHVCDGDEALNVGVDHPQPVPEVALMRGAEPQAETGVVDLQL